VRYRYLAHISELQYLQPPEPDRNRTEQRFMGIIVDVRQIKAQLPQLTKIGDNGPGKTGTAGDVESDEIERLKPHNKR
jgi:hypothetical protein